MYGFLEYLFGNEDFMPHGWCMLWQPEQLGVHIVAADLKRYCRHQ
jgi:hypothetical protein